MPSKRALEQKVEELTTALSLSNADLLETRKARDAALVAKEKAEKERADAKVAKQKLWDEVDKLHRDLNKILRPTVDLGHGYITINPMSGVHTLSALKP